MDELQEMAKLGWEAADRTEAKYRKLAKDDASAAKILLIQARDQFRHTLEGIRSQRQASSEQHREIVNHRHEQPGGSRSKQQRMRQLWASGKYLTRDECAEKNCQALGMSFVTARKALNKQPGPDMARKTAVDWLRDLIADSGRNSKDIYRLAKAAGYSKDAMKRAKTATGVTVVRQGKDWFWYPRGAELTSTR